MFFNNYVHKEDFEVVRQAVSELTKNQTEIKTGINMIKWLVVVMVLPIMTIFFDSALSKSKEEEALEAQEFKIQQLETRIQNMLPPASIVR